MPYIGKSPLHGYYQKLDDFSGEDAEVKRVAESVWTDEIKAAYADFQSK